MYSPDQIEEMERELDLWLGRVKHLSDTGVCFKFNDKQARKFATQGFVRRLRYLEHAVRKIFYLYPPNSRGADRDAVQETELFLQAFVMNVFGAIDNLAWVWTLERGITKPDGQLLNRTEVVFDGQKAKTLRANLTPVVLKEIEEASDWFSALRDYRDGIAHQIPIYIPRLVSPKVADRWREIDRDIEQAIVENDIDLFEELMSEQYRTGDYGSLMALCDKHAPLMLHPQIICDLATVTNLGEKIFSELHS